MKPNHSEDAQPNNASRVQWIIPPSKSAVPYNQLSNGSQRNQSGQFNSDDSGFSEDGRIHNCKSEPKQSIITQSEFRAITTLVQGHLDELWNHQNLIKKARSAKVNNQNIPLDDNFISRNDTQKLKIRDEQTKAIETIKQLTNYLKEVSNLKQRCELPSNQPVDESIVGKLSDLRIEIVSALNSFILNNSDIDIPIVHPEDVKHLEYDLCIDAHVSTRNYPDSQILQPSNPTKDKEYSARIKPPSTINTIAENRDEVSEQQSQCIATTLSLSQSTTSLEKRLRDIEKIERDTIELRQLFAEFHNLVQTQGEQLDLIENNIVICDHKVREGKHHLRSTSLVLSLMVPATLGGLLGALVGGPIGFVVGGKIGSAAVGCASSLVGVASACATQLCMTPGKRIKVD